MKKQSNAPQIRFQNFEDEWVKQSLGKTVEIIMGQSPDSKNYTDNPNDYILVQGNADMQNGRVVPRVWTTQITKLAEKGDLILSVRAPVGDIGKTDYNVVLGRGVAAIKGNEFLFQLLTKMKQSHYWSKFSTGSTFESINSNDIKSAEIYLPSIEEQSAIGSLFRTLDDLLTSYKNNLANYQSLKATMLSKMFPKAGQTIPEIRLDGFEGKWENKILSEVTNITMGQSPKSENYTDNPNDYILVQGNADIKDKQVVPRLWTTEVTKMAEIGDIILTVRAPVGDIGKTDFNVVIGRGVAAIKGNDFIFFTLEKMKMTGFWNRFSTGSTFESISSNDIKEAIVQLPTLDEQQAIGAYFSNLDNLIASHQEKITQLETLKKKLLQDMFI
ncbi:restriction endonuclease subunit S [Streptococcus vestibularis]|uniref:restriction endonuclease subunit S n=1 Tax=Streptococcus vestibularis TaxID=1343 RepID=UPI00232CF8D2|nr:restriction endonuclease subunit S [Streptococcus vestibularis]MDB6183901.1 restriction endonuclease subunit S [Streptococcus vestibularis]MDB6200728.1 restriction endonuclease subunit S [Streptococcus vestibularis]MDB6207308.1 restriction endonuclease subunit S [Streptococcus vestibularis]MDB6211097.1 restriction endonuclease subunit S [Streptococcus vestibularis]MDB6214518.1 restriction endonuclease subunit S [Streptococcus vestibularis]